MVVRHLSKRASIAIQIESAQRQTLANLFDWVLQPVGEGGFTVPEDALKVGEVLRSLVRETLLGYLSEGKLHNFRTILNLQDVILRDCHVKPITDIIPGLISKTSDPSSFFLDEFVHQNGFRSLFTRDGAGWTPMCYAALSGSPQLICALLEARADPNDEVKVAWPS